MMRVWTLAVMAAVALSAGTGELRAQQSSGPTGSVTALSVVPTNGRAEVVLAIDGSVELKDFTLTGPHRVVLDLHGARLRMRPAGYDRVTRGGIRNVRMAQNAEDVVRVVLDLDAARRYSVVRGASEIRVTIAGDEEDDFLAWSVGNVRRDQVAGGTTGAGVVPATPARTTPPSRSASQPAAPPRTSFRSSGPTHVVAGAQQQPRMTVTYTEMDVAEVIKFIAGFANRTIVVGADVKGTVTAEIHDQPWDVALQTILASRNLAATEDPKTGIILVDSYANILAKQALEPLETQLVKINYQQAPALVRTVESLLSRDCGLGLASGGSSQASGGSRPGQSGCVMRGSVTADTATNALLITDVPSRIPEITRFIQGLDVRTPLISIKAKIILVNRTDIEDIGISYDLGTQRQFFNRLVQRIDPTSYTPIDSDGDGIPDAIGGGEPFDQNVNIIDLGGNSLSALANANQRVPNPALNLIFSTALGKFDLTAFVDALQEVRLADVQAEPSITVLDNHQARMFGGSEVPVRVIDAGGTGGGQGGSQFPVATVEFREAGLVLDVTPQVTNDRRILMTLNAERSGLVEAASDVGFVIDRQQATSRVLVADGETAVIGGFTITEVTVTKSGIPLLVDLPLIGKLFGRTLTREEKRELLVLVTPHILEDGDVVGSDPTRR